MSVFWFDDIFSINTKLSRRKADSTKTRKRLEQYENFITWQSVFCQHMDMWMETIGIRNRKGDMPSTLSERVILQSILFHDCVCLFIKNGNVFGLPIAPMGDFNPNGDPEHGWVYSKNGLYTKDIRLYMPGEDESDFLKKTISIAGGKDIAGVIVWGSKTRYPYINTLIRYTDYVADTFRTIDIARRNIKTPFVIKCEKTQESTVENFLKDREENSAAVLTTQLRLDSIDIVPIPASSESLHDAIQLIDWYHNQFRSEIGAGGNSQIDKKGENVISDEIHMNDTYEEIMTGIKLDEIQRGFDNFNKILAPQLSEPIELEVYRKHERVNDISSDEGKDSKSLSESDPGRSERDDK